jgi:hypothetical protein
MQALLRIGTAVALTLAGFGLIVESSRFGLLRNRPLFLLVAIPLALLCLWSWRRANPQDQDRP